MKHKKVLAAVLAFLMLVTVLPITALAAPPLEGYPGVDELPAYDTLPNPFEFFSTANDPNGDGYVSNTDEWDARREEIKDLVQRYWLGYKWPTRPQDVKGTATVNETTGAVTGASIQVTNPDRNVSGSLPLNISMPSREQRLAAWGSEDTPVPFVISYSYNGAFNAANLNAQGYALLSFTPSNVYNDSATINPETGTVNRTGLYVDLYPYNKDVYEYASGAMMGWAWAASQILNAMEQPAENGQMTFAEYLGLDAGKTAVTGHSRYGKAAMFAAAFDDRISICFPSESGGSGIQSYRYKVEGKIFNFNTYAKADRVYGKTETPTVSYGQGNTWFPETAAALVNKDNQFPFDSSDIIALVAPRPFFTVSGIDAHWLGNEGGVAAVQAAAEVYNFIGKNEIEKNNAAVRARESNHIFYPRDFCFALAIMDREFKQDETDQTLHVQDLFPNGTGISGMSYPAKDYDTVADMNSFPFEINSSYMPWTSPNKYSLWTAQENFLVARSVSITAHSNAPDVDLYLPDGVTKVDAAAKDGNTFTFNLTPEQAVYGRYELRTVGDAKENRSVFFAAVSLADSLRHGTTKGDEGEENRVMGFSSRLANTAEDLPLVYVTGDDAPLTMSLTPARRKVEETTLMEYGIQFHDPLFSRLGDAGWTKDNDHIFNVKNLKFVTIPGYTFEIAYSEIYASSARNGQDGANQFTKPISWNVERYNNGPAAMWPEWPDTKAERDSGVINRPEAPEPKPTDFKAEITGVEVTRESDATNITLSFSEAMRTGEYGFGLNIADVWTTTWNEDGTKVTLTVKDLDITATSVNGSLIVYRLMDAGGNLIGGPVEESFLLPFVPPDYTLEVEADKTLINKGEYFNLETSFNVPAATNAITITYQYDASKFVYHKFTPAEGVTVARTTPDAAAGTITLVLIKLEGYDWQGIGTALFAAREDTELPKGATTIGAGVEYAYKEPNGGKFVLALKGGVKLHTGRPWAGEYPTLVDLSNAIDYFGVTVEDGKWDEALYYDFNENGEIDISDISYIAYRIQ